MRRFVAILAVLAGLVWPAFGAEKLLDGATLIFPKNATGSQMCSAILVTKNRKVIVFDGGTAGDLDSLLAHLAPYGNTVHHWFISHAHLDHIGALLELCRRGNVDLRVQKLYYNFPDEEFLVTNETWDAKDTKFIFARLPEIPFLRVELAPSMRLTVDEVTIEVLNPPQKIKGGNAVNESSVVLKVTAGTTKILFPGDLGEQGSAWLLLHAKEKLPADIVVMSHHGQNGATKEFYAAVAPQIAVWPTPVWLWENDGGAGYGSANFQTNFVKCWMQELKVKKHLITGFGDVVIQ